jgi:hypothetical protein
MDVAVSPWANPKKTSLRIDFAKHRPVSEMNIPARNPAAISP